MEGEHILLSVSTSYILRFIPIIKVRSGETQVWSVEQDLTGIVTQGWSGGRPSLFSIPVNDAIKKMFDDAGSEDKFDCQIVVKCDYPGLPIPSYEKSYPDTPYVFEPKRAAG